MSWGISVAGKGSEVGLAIDKAVEQALSWQQNETTRVIVKQTSQLMKDFAAAFPQHVVTLESSGHVEPEFGNATMTFRVWPV